MLVSDLQSELARPPISDDTTTHPSLRTLVHRGASNPKVTRGNGASRTWTTSSRAGTHAHLYLVPHHLQPGQSSHSSLSFLFLCSVYFCSLHTYWNIVLCLIITDAGYECCRVLRDFLDVIGWRSWGGGWLQGSKYNFLYNFWVLRIGGKVY